MTVFHLDPRLDADTLPVMELGLCSLRLMNDRRWPWLILVPRIAGACELHDLPDADRDQITRETIMAGRVLSQVTGCEKINTAAIGNIVRQLHVHVIARSDGDANWPGPVWGFGTREPYGHDAATVLIAAIKSASQSEFGMTA